MTEELQNGATEAQPKNNLQALLADALAKEAQASERALDAIEDSHTSVQEREALEGEWKQWTDRVAQLKACIENKQTLEEQQNQEQEKQRIEKQSEWHDLSSYIEGSFLEDVEAFRRGATLKTGWGKLDNRLGGLWPGMYLLGAMPSMGKTSFALQLADQVAEQKRKVLFFETEQSRQALLGKCLSRLNALKAGKNSNNPEEAWRRSPSGKALRADRLNDAQLKWLMADYKKGNGSYLSIEFTGKRTVDELCAQARRTAQAQGEAPVVIFDYLQNLRPRLDTSLGKKDTRAEIDMVSEAIFNLSSELGSPVIAISSFSRSNYYSPVGIDSFKESGSLEYDAEYIWALQYDVMASIEKGGNDSIGKRREIVEEAKKAMPRKVQLKVLKQKEGEGELVHYFDYYPTCDIFAERNLSAQKGEASGFKLK